MNYIAEKMKSRRRGWLRLSRHRSHVGTTASAAKSEKIDGEFAPSTRHVYGGGRQHRIVAKRFQRNGNEKKSNGRRAEEEAETFQRKNGLGKNGIHSEPRELNRIKRGRGKSVQGTRMCIINNNKLAREGKKKEEAKQTQRTNSSATPARGGRLRFPRRNPNPKSEPQAPVPPA